MSVAGQLEALVVDDDDAVREVLRDLLEDVGYVVREARDGAVAVGILRASKQSQLVLLDYLLPGLDGEEVLAALAGDAPYAEDKGGAAGALADERRAVRSITRHAFVLMTASPQLLSRELAARLAVLGVPLVAKPFDIEVLYAAVAQAVRHLAP